MEIKNTIELVTPDRARELLLLNTSNRPASKSCIQKLANAMSNGDWMLNGDSIKISKTGALIDGQHRLMAIIKSGVSVNIFMATGLDDECFKTIDQQRTRTVADLIHVKLKGKNLNLAAAMVPLVSSYEAGRMPTNAGMRLTKQDSLAFYEARAVKFQESATFAAKNKILRAFFSSSYSAFLHFIFSAIDEEMADDFFDRLISGKFDTDKDPTYVLRQRLISDNSNKLKKDSEIVKSAYCIFAWNAYRNNQKISFVRWILEGNNKQDYPKAI